MREAIQRGHLRNWLQSLLLFSGMLALMGTVGWLFGGPAAMYGVVLGGAIFLVLAPRVSPRFVLHFMRAHPLSPGQAPQLYTLVRDLARRAHLPQTPFLFYVPSRLMNAFSVGVGTQASIAISDGLLRGLDGRELRGVLAHEISHIRHKDIWVMTLADMISQLTWTFSLFGQLLLLINLPIFLMHGQTLPWGPLLLLIFAPALSALLQLALSRRRELEADLGAVELTHDPRGLASALEKLHRQEERVLARFFLPRGRPSEPSWLRTHPQVEERVRRLLALADEYESEEAWHGEAMVPSGIHPVQRRPRRHFFSGLRY